MWGDAQCSKRQQCSCKHSHLCWRFGRLDVSLRTAWAVLSSGKQTMPFSESLVPEACCSCAPFPAVHPQGYFLVDIWTEAGLMIIDHYSDTHVNKGLV